VEPHIAGSFVRLDATPSLLGLEELHTASTWTSRHAARVRTRADRQIGRGVRVYGRTVTGTPIGSGTTCADWYSCAW
jgi:hypothetical protein